VPAWAETTAPAWAQVAVWQSVAAVRLLVALASSKGEQRAHLQSPHTCGHKSPWLGSCPWFFHVLFASTFEELKKLWLEQLRDSLRQQAKQLKLEQLRGRLSRSGCMAGPGMNGCLLHLFVAQVWPKNEQSIEAGKVKGPCAKWTLPFVNDDNWSLTYATPYTHGHNSR